MNQSTSFREPLLKTSINTTEKKSSEERIFTTTSALFDYNNSMATLAAEPDVSAGGRTIDFATESSINCSPNNKIEQNSPYSYPPNITVTSRYTLLNFFPKSLLEQFRRLANVYFLVIGIIAAVGAYTNYYETAVVPYGILGPMGLVVLISVVKDGVEDWKRHTADARINDRAANVIVPAISTANNTNQCCELRSARWRDLKVGDLLLLLADDELPADAVLLASGGVQGKVAYVETAAIDGETNLKLKTPALNLASPPVGATEMMSSPELATSPYISLSPDRSKIFGLPAAAVSTGHAGQSIFRSLRVSAEPPNGSIHRFSGALEIGWKNSNSNPSRDLDQLPLGEKQLLLRGSVLRATEWAVCMVLYTGNT
jgi:phospholipid-transporting ATPase